MNTKVLKTKLSLSIHWRWFEFALKQEPRGASHSPELTYATFGAHRDMLSIRKAMEALPLVTFYIRAPPQPATPRRGHWGHPGNCHEQSLFFT